MLKRFWSWLVGLCFPQAPTPTPPPPPQQDTHRPPVHRNALRYTREDVLLALVRFKIVTGTYPRKRKGSNTWKPAHHELAADYGIPGCNTLTRMFGSLTQAWEMADRYAAQLAETPSAQ